MQHPVSDLGSILPRAPDGSSQSGIGRQVAHGATWVVLQRLAVRLIGVVSMLVLVRLLAPADFGIVALATAFSAGLDVLLELGFDIALIHRQTSDRTQYDTAWTLSILRGVFVAGVLCAAAWPLGAFYNDPRLTSVLLWLALAYFVSGFQNIGIVDFRKNLMFDREFKLLVWCKVASFITTLTMAWIWRDFHALIAGIAVGKIASVILSYTMHPYRPRFSLVGAGGFLRFSKWLGLVNLVNIANTRLDAAIVGKFAGAGGLGVYAVAYELATLATTELIWPIVRALLPGYAKLAGDKRQLSAAFIDALGIIMLLAAPVTIGIAVMAGPAVRLVLGPDWLAAIPVMQILALYGLLDMPTANVKALFLAVGRPDLIVWRDIPAALVLVPCLIGGTLVFGAPGAAAALAISAAVSLVVAFALLRRQLDVGVGACFDVAWRPLVAGAAMGVVVVALQFEWAVEPTFIRLLGQTVLESLLGVAFYLAMVTSLWVLAGKPSSAPEAHALTFALETINRFRRASATPV